MLERVGFGLDMNMLPIIMSLPHKKMNMPPMKMILPPFFVARTSCKNDQTHQKHVFATLKNDFATSLVARSFLGVARSLKSVAKTFLLRFVHIFA